MHTNDIRVLLFLDYDGVLQTPRRAQWREFEFLPQLEAILRDYPGLAVVISSTHRYQKSLETLRLAYSTDIASRVVGATPDLPLGNADGGRFEEIRQWRSANACERIPFIALDDEPRLYPRECEELFLLSPYGGLDDFAAERLRESLDAILAA